MELSERDRQVAVWYSLGRAGFGALALVAPSVVKAWIGDDARRPGVRVLTRAFAARDVALGAGSYLALSGDKPNGEEVARWLQVSAVSDSIDAAATLLGARHLPKRGVFTTLLLAVGGAVTGFRLASRTR